MAHYPKLAPDLQKRLASAIQKRREAYPLSRNELAVKLDLTPSTVYGWEKRGNTPELFRLYQIADALHCNVWDLLP